MAYIAGKSLQERIDACGPLGVAEILRIGRAVAGRRQIAAASGHRDYSANSGEVRAWDLDEPEASGTGIPLAFAVAYSPDGKTLASGGGAEDGATAPGLLTFWDVAGQAPIAAAHAHDGRAWSVAFAPDGKALASAGEDGLVRYWDVPGPVPGTR